jgi:hypothetical protein
VPVRADLFVFPIFRVVVFVTAGRTVVRYAGRHKPIAQRQCNVLVDRTRMRLLLLHAELGQQVEYDAGFHFELARQLVNPDFLHTNDC